MATGLDQIAATLGEVFPVRENQVELAFVESTSAGKVTFRLILWDKAPGGELSIRDIKEQELYLYDPAYLTGDVPILSYLRGWSLALREVFQRAPMSTFETLMPHDLSDGGVLKLRKATTPEDYRKAFLVKSRLGKFLPRPDQRPTEPS
jgi:hypothetical protein